MSEQGQDQQEQEHTGGYGVVLHHSYIMIYNLII